MKSKNTLLATLIVLLIILFKNSLAEEFYFETPEIEVLNNGNLLKTDKGGKVITDTKTEITADIFEYNKSTSILKAKKMQKLLMI